ncbi:S49 family peptidase [Salmonella enterica subsp. enterica serovar Minnesota]|nr:S49 family peptidase [Salmonella enterica subsp. enterica serovar Minnesota]ECI4646673.1 S49 family peptidase [Salmonella enterica subsp. salamae]
MNLPLLAQRLFNTPLAIHPRKAEIVVAALAERLGISHISTEYAWSGDDESFSHPARDSGYDVINGVAVIPVEGTLVHKLGSLRPWSGMTGYDGIRQTFLGAINDPQVRAVCLDIDSPGGEVAGCFDLVDLIYQARGEKPIHAILTEGAYSAAYAIASAADRIIVPRTGGVGSIGVIVIHCDWSQHIKNDGIKVTIVKFGDRKMEVNTLTPLSDEARAALQHDVNETGELFVNTVARNRGIAASVVRDTQGATFTASEGVALGLADEINAPDVAFLELLTLTEN